MHCHLGLDQLIIISIFGVACAAFQPVVSVLQCVLVAKGQERWRRLGGRGVYRNKNRHRLPVCRLGVLKQSPMGMFGRSFDRGAHWLCGCERPMVLFISLVASRASEGGGTRKHRPVERGGA